MRFSAVFLLHAHAPTSYSAVFLLHAPASASAPIKIGCGLMRCGSVRFGAVLAVWSVVSVKLTLLFINIVFKVAVHSRVTN